MRILDASGRIYYPHYVWEDANAGLYNMSQYDDELIRKCILIFEDQELFWDVLCQMRIDWEKSFEFNLSNKTQNRKAWLGQAACCYNHGASFNVTIAAWRMLSEKNKVESNETAQRMIDLFEKEVMNAKNIHGAKCTGRCERTRDMDF